MSLELLGFRLLAPSFGYSLYVFGSLIGLVMIALAFGYWLGGYLGDRGVSLAGFMKIILTGSVYLFFISLSYQLVLNWLAAFSVVAGALAGSFILFFFPMAVFASTSPYFTRFLAVNQKQAVGSSSGSVSAWTTVGSLLGTFATAFYLVPELGAAFTLYFNTRLSFLIPVIFLSLKKSKTYLFFMLLPLFF